MAKPLTTVTYRYQTYPHKHVVPLFVMRKRAIQETFAAMGDELYLCQDIVIIIMKFAEETYVVHQTRQPQRPHRQGTPFVRSRTNLGFFPVSYTPVKTHREKQDVIRYSQSLLYFSDDRPSEEKALVTRAARKRPHEPSRPKTQFECNADGCLQRMHRLSNQRFRLTICFCGGRGDGGRGDGGESSRCKTGTKKRKTMSKSFSEANQSHVVTYKNSEFKSSDVYSLYLASFWSSQPIETLHMAEIPNSSFTRRVTHYDSLWVCKLADERQPRCMDFIRRADVVQLTWAGRLDFVPSRTSFGLHKDWLYMFKCVEPIYLQNIQIDSLEIYRLNLAQWIGAGKAFRPGDFTHVAHLELSDLLIITAKCTWSVTLTNDNNAIIVVTSNLHNNSNSCLWSVDFNEKNIEESSVQQLHFPDQQISFLGKVDHGQRCDPFPVLWQRNGCILLVTRVNEWKGSPTKWQLHIVKNSEQGMLRELVLPLQTGQQYFRYLGLFTG